MKIKSLENYTRDSFKGLLQSGVPCICKALGISKGSWGNYRKEILAYYGISENEWKNIVLTRKQKQITELNCNHNPARGAEARKKISESRKNNQDRYNKSREEERLNRQKKVLEREANRTGVILTLDKVDLLPLRPLPTRNFEVKCKLCGFVFNWRVGSNCHGLHCPKCSALSGYRSHREVYFEKLICSLGYEAHHFIHCLDRYEVDIFIPELNLALEFNGIRYHSFTKCFKGEAKSKDYHQQKLKIALSKGIKLLQFWEDDSDDFIKKVLSSFIKGLNYDESKVKMGRFNQYCTDHNLINYDIFPEEFQEGTPLVLDFGDGYKCANSGYRRIKY